MKKIQIITVIMLAVSSQQLFALPEEETFRENTEEPQRIITTEMSAPGITKIRPDLANLINQPIESTVGTQGRVPAISTARVPETHIEPRTASPAPSTPSTGFERTITPPSPEPAAPVTAEAARRNMQKALFTPGQGPESSEYKSALTAHKEASTTIANAKEVLEKTRTEKLRLEREKGEAEYQAERAQKVGAPKKVQEVLTEKMRQAQEAHKTATEKHNEAIKNFQRIGGNRGHLTEKSTHH